MMEAGITPQSVDEIKVNRHRATLISRLSVSAGGRRMLVETAPAVRQPVGGEE
jgi:hypothetical protein